MEFVEIIDLSTGKVTKIPRTELASNMVKVQFKEGIYWADVGQLRQNTKIQHPPFQGELKKKIQEIQKILFCVRGMSYEEWEQPFRCDAHPEKEIEMWFRVARRFRSLTKERFPTPKEQIDVYNVLATVLCAGNDADVTCSNLLVLNKSQVKELIVEFREALKECQWRTLRSM